MTQRLSRSGTVLGSLLTCAAPALVLLVTATSASGQSRASERASVSQTVDGTVVAVEYSRPLARDRSNLFGGVVHWGEVWTPGANWATVLDLNRSVTIDGHPVAAGRWSVWIVVAEHEPWELVLDPRPRLYHTQPPEPADDQIRFPVERAEGTEHVEALTWSFPTVTRAGTTLSLAWGTTRVPLEIEVERRPTTIAPGPARPYLGAWEMMWEPRPSDAPGEGPPPPPSPFDVRLVGDSLLVAHTMIPGFPPLDLILMPLAEGIFRPGFVINGEWDEAVGEMVLEFDLDGGNAVGFDVRQDNDEVMATGWRMAGQNAAPRPGDAGPLGTEHPAEIEGGEIIGPNPEWQIASAVLAVPAALRDGAEVRARTDDGHTPTLREGSNGMTCLADVPGDGRFAAACYHDSLEPFMERGRELARQGIEGAARDEMRWREIESGVLPMPVAAMVYNLQFPTEDFDPATTDPATGGRLHALYITGATAASTGLSVQPGAEPWLMHPGTPTAHVMIALPARRAP
jgi:hypothetical protein